MRMILAGIATLGLLFGSASTTYGNTEFDEVCEKLEEEVGMDCTGILPPVIVETGLPWSIGAYGAYMHGEPYVFILPEDMIPPPWTQRRVLIHETVHYVLYNALWGMMDRCGSEELSRIWTADILGIPYDDTWQEQYECFTRVKTNEEPPDGGTTGNTG